MRVGRQQSLFALAAVVALVAGLAVAGTIPGALTPAGAARASAQPLDAPHKTGKLSPRLAALSGGLASASLSSQAHALSLPRSGVGSLVRRSNGALLVEIRTSDTSAAGVARLVALGAHTVNVSRTYSTVTATIAPSALTAIAGDPDVIYVSEVLAPLVSPIAAPAQPATVKPDSCSPTDSEGDSLMNVATARATKDVDGANQTIGILSDSFDTDTTATTHAAQDIASGDLPGPANPCGYTTPVHVFADYSGGGQTDEGRAMTELAHALAPAADLYFATASNNELDMASQISNMVVHRASVIVDDTEYLDEPFFQDGPIANAVNAASAAGVAYFSAAGNANVVVGGHNVSSYEAPAYRETGCPASVTEIEPLLGCHNFDTTGGADNGDDITVAPGGGFAFDLQWAEPWGGVADDLDAFIVDNGTVVGGSGFDNTLSQTPYEFAEYENDTATPQTVSIVIGKYSGPGDPRLKFVIVGSGGITGVQYDTSTGGDIVGPSIFGHNGAASVGSTAAIPYNDSTTSEDYSSRGPVTHYFEPTPGLAPLSAPEVLDKPDFAATDDVQNVFFGEPDGGAFRFAGTSAAAPQAAAIAALLRQYDPALTPAQVMATLRATARTVATNGTPDAVGGGYLDADAALASVTPLPGAPAIDTVSNGNGRAVVEWEGGNVNFDFPVTGYRLTPWIDGVAQPAHTFAANVGQATITGLTNGATYAFTLASLNVNGAGPDSSPSAPIMIGQPSAPTPVSAVTGNGRATVHWTVPTQTYGIPITGYQVTPWLNDVAQAPSIFHSTATTETVGGLTNGQTYQFSIAALNTFETGVDSGLGHVVTIGLPFAPSALRATAGNGRAILHWTAPTSANGSPITDYIVNSYINGVQDSSGKDFTGTLTARVLPALSNGTTYTFRVLAENANGDSALSPASTAITVGTPLAPGGLLARPLHKAARVHWSAPPNNGAAITKYIVTPYMGGVAQRPLFFSASATARTITGLVTGRIYEFSVAAENARGAGPRSEVSNAVKVT